MRKARRLSYKCKIYALNFTATHGFAKEGRDIARSFRIVSCCEFFRRKTFCRRMHSRVLLFRAPARTPSSHYLSALGRKILRYCKLQRAAIFVRRQTNRSANREELCAIAREVVAMRLRAEAKVA